jgi:hypothetical protein
MAFIKLISTMAAITVSGELSFADNKKDTAQQQMVHSPQ